MRLVLENDRQVTGGKNGSYGNHGAHKVLVYCFITGVIILIRAHLYVSFSQLHKVISNWTYQDNMGHVR